MKYNTIKEAAEVWVREMNAIPQEMVLRLMNADPDDWSEVTRPAKYNHVYDDSKNEYGEITEINDDIYSVELNNGEEIECVEDDFEVCRDDLLPMWGTMWSFGDNIDDYWLEEKNGLELMSRCGFRIYQSEEFGYYFGIDGAGYDFYEDHWIPLYKARGLHWHKESEEQ